MDSSQPAPLLAEQKRKYWGNMIWISAIFLVVSICAGVAAPLIGMLNAFVTLRAAGAADPSALAGDISTALIGSLVAIPFAFAALVLFIIAIVRHRKFSNPSRLKARLSGIMIRRLILILTVGSVAALIALNLDPVTTKPHRLVILCSLAGICFGPLFLLWKSFAVRVVFIALPLLMLAPFLLPGRDIKQNELRDDYLKRIVSHEGIGYHWGGESRRGIDCSGLPRKALRDALLNQGLRTLNGRCTRLFLKHWWNDASAKALAEGHLGFAVPTGEIGTVAAMDYDPLQPGDLAVTEGRQHVLIFLGGEKWIQADPGAEKVTIANGRTGKSGWFSVPVTLHRWSLLAEHR